LERGPQRGHHVRLKKTGRRNALVVPLHKEIRKGTLSGILCDAGLTPDKLRWLL
jgi:predicted RNA binding protein YcfA (HicA-like mRNA interferase family)